MTPSNPGFVYKADGRRATAVAVAPRSEVAIGGSATVRAGSHDLLVTFEDGEKRVFSVGAFRTEFQEASS